MAVIDGRGHGPHARGSRAGRWQDGLIISTTGYVKIRVGRSHPLADPNGYAYEHLVVWCAAGRPRPSKGEILHHINHDKRDSRIENLELVNRSDHNRIHNSSRVRDRRGRLLSTRASAIINAGARLSTIVNGKRIA